MVEMNRWWGAIATVGCGLGIRYIDPILTTTGLVGAVGIATACLLALVDALDTAD